MPSAMAGANMYSCMTCRLLVTNQEIQREHYQSDWHRYNLKRKVASLPSVSLEAFLHKASAQEALLIAAESCRRQNWNCFMCKKHFASEKQLNNHLTSKKHLALATRRVKVDEVPKPTYSKPAEPNDDIEECLDAEPLEENECLFCPIHSADTDKHLQHMYLSHGFFIPMIDYIRDVHGLLDLLASLVGECLSCVYCKNRSFSSVEATQHHMRDKSHCKLDFDDAEYFSTLFSDYYDFSSSYPDHETNKEDNLPISTNLTVTDDMSLVLPSGARAGHRAFRHIYKQRLKPSRDKTLSIVFKLPSQPSPEEYAMKLRVLRERKIIRECNKQRMRLGVKANKLQPFLRKQC